METIHVKFDKLTTMASKHNYLEHKTNCFNNDDSSAEFTSTPSQEDLDNLFDIEAPPIISSSEEQISSLSFDNAVESVQKDSADLDGNTLLTPYNSSTFEEAKLSSIAADPSNMHEFNNVQHSTHTWTSSSIRTSDW
ncbi:hypothetical protein Tco_0655112 [Tanacetum coccineum]|uniref:Uncharacterized protein n=1 Tax=Tanacetum coccineum TaxID=301880 RepID=A0ABQ4X536_9ASTR